VDELLPPPVPKRIPTVFMRSIRWHTYHGEPQPVDQIYVAYADEVENIETLKFAVRDAAPPRATRGPR
jgi:hypothetical protein